MKCSMRIDLIDEFASNELISNVGIWHMALHHFSRIFVHPFPFAKDGQAMQQWKKRHHLRERYSKQIGYQGVTYYVCKTS